MPISRNLQDFHTLQHTYTHRKSHLEAFAHSTQVYHHISSLEGCVHYSHMVFTEIPWKHWVMCVWIKPMELHMLYDKWILWFFIKSGHWIWNYNLQIGIFKLEVIIWIPDSEYRYCWGTLYSYFHEEGFPLLQGIQTFETVNQGVKHHSLLISQFFLQLISKN